MLPEAPHRELGRVLGLMARAARSRRLYPTGSPAFDRMIEDVHNGLLSLLDARDLLELAVRPTGLWFDGHPVLEAPNPEESLPFGLYRDGIRRLGFLPGLSVGEVRVVVDAAAAGFGSSPLGEDTVTFLWRHELEHVRYVVIDTVIVEAGESPGEDAPASPLDGAIDALLRDIYGAPSPDIGVGSVSLDRSDIDARKVAERLDAVDEMAPGFFPPRRFPLAPAYAEELRAELEREDEHRLGLRAGHAVLDALKSGSARGPRLFDALLRMHDGALFGGNLRLSAFLVAGVRRLPPSPGREDWIRQALAEPRLRPVAQGTQDLRGLLDLFRAGGRDVVPLLLSLLPSFEEPADRRAIADLVLELGVPDVARLADLVKSDQAFVARDAVYILARLADPGAKEALLEAEHHPSPNVRLALLEEAPTLAAADRLELTTRALDDPDPAVRVMAVRGLVRIPSAGVDRLLEQRVTNPSFETEPKEVQLALLVGHTLLSQSRALPLLARWVKRGEGRFSGRKAETTAVLAVRALRGLRDSSGGRALLERACAAKNRRVRETAQWVLTDAARGR